MGVFPQLPSKIPGAGQGHPLDVRIGDNPRFGRIAPRLLVACVLAFMVTAAPAAAYTFAEPFVRQTGPEAMVFDWSTQKCEDDDITDEAARAFRDDAGNGRSEERR